ncbi:MAG: hypothetical protein ABIX01_03320 [Chitinophagaceae bacterium]
MKKKITKQQVLDICIQKQEEQVENFDSRVNSMKLDINNKDYSASQSEDRQAGKTELLRIYERELTFSTNDLNTLQSIDPTVEYSTVQPGALVTTDQLLFFIAISTEKFEIGGATVIGISARAPIYQAMLGLAKGDSFKFNDMDYLIEALY